jgi:hypothetical protein
LENLTPTGCYTFEQRRGVSRIGIIVSTAAWLGDVQPLQVERDLRLTLRGVQPEVLLCRSISGSEPIGSAYLLFATHQRAT